MKRPSKGFIITLGAITAVVLAVVLGVRWLRSPDAFGFWLERGRDTQNERESASTGDTTPTVPPHGSGIALDEDGLGIVRFGDDTDESIAALTKILGPPDEDTGPLDATEVEAGAVGSCEPGNHRNVEWGGLDVTFFDGPSADEGLSGLRSYEYGKRQAGVLPYIGTSKGITVGSTMADLRRAYGAALQEAASPMRVADLGFYVGNGAAVDGTPRRVEVIVAGDRPCD